MKRFKNHLHGLYADLGNHRTLSVDIQTITPPITTNNFSLAQ